ncbi:uncharacterized protein M437DRAFT_66307 [Aureobasidium melanogenum CBS 110374]|uniref:Uncharacterized protein n=1 Tax=Aureobasidium melanogenum (strain CBS 110374) TaxID=1043003 RepID=A0A074VT64_AURM1|nr:uncharacterized protein M437DRAFT_66307 [Aureobasidium melanogenum CBS 110374]KEQ62439.1 hypothetical protein M437DRAFT_66307 [Aureobasidium melanogenum CBS 110374]
MTDDMNAQDPPQTDGNTEKTNRECKQTRTSAAATHAIAITEQLAKATDMTFDLASYLENSEDVNYKMEDPGPDLSNLPATPSLPISSIPTFYLAPSITQAMQQMGPAIPNLPYALWPIVEPENPDESTLPWDDIIEKSSQTVQAAEFSPISDHTSEPHRQTPQSNPSYAETPPLMTQKSSDGSKKQAAMEQQKEKEGDTGVAGEDIVHVGFSDQDFMFMKNLLALNKFELCDMNRELELTQESNTQLRKRLFDATEELAGAKEQLSQKDGYISACDKKIGALQRKIVLLAHPYTALDLGQTPTGTIANANPEPQLHKSTSKPETMPILHKPSAEPKAVDRSLSRSQIFAMPKMTEKKIAGEREARLKESQKDYEALLEEKEALISRITKEHFERQAVLEDRYMLSAMSEKLRRVVKEIIWEIRELRIENEKFWEENEKLKEELDQARTANNSKLDHVSVPPKTSEGVFDTVSQQNIPETATSHTEADQVRHAVGEGHEDTNQ